MQSAVNAYRALQKGKLYLKGVPLEVDWADPHDDPVFKHFEIHL